jgi:hypothetical protein
MQLECLTIELNRLQRLVAIAIPSGMKYWDVRGMGKESFEKQAIVAPRSCRELGGSVLIARLPQAPLAIGDTTFM